MIDDNEIIELEARLENGNTQGRVVLIRPKPVGTRVYVKTIDDVYLFSGVITEVRGRTAQIGGLIQRLANTPASRYIRTYNSPVSYREALTDYILHLRLTYPWLNIRIPPLYVRKDNPENPWGLPLTRGFFVQGSEPENPMFILDVLNDILAGFPEYIILERLDYLIIVPPRDAPYLVLKGDFNNNFTDSEIVLEEVPLYLTGKVGNTQIQFHISPGGVETRRIEDNILIVYYTGGTLLITTSMPFYFLAYPSPVQLEDYFSINPTSSFKDKPTKAIVINRDRMAFISTNNVLQPASLRIWGRYSGSNCSGENIMDHPTLEDIGNPTGVDLGLVQAGEFYGARPHVNSYTAYIPAAGEYIVGDWVDITTEFYWWADQTGDFPGPGRADPYPITAITRVPIGGTASVRSQIRLPGEPYCLDPYVEIVFRPDVQNGILKGVYALISGEFTSPRYSGNLIDLGHGNWALGLGIIFSASRAEVWGQDPTTVQAVYTGDEEEFDAIRNTFGEITREVAISTIVLDEETALSMAKAIVHRPFMFSTPTEVKIIPADLARIIPGYAVEVGPIRGRVIQTQYREHHTPTGINVQATLLLDQVALIRPPSTSDEGGDAYYYSAYEVGWYL